MSSLSGSVAQTVNSSSELSVHIDLGQLTQLITAASRLRASSEGDVYSGGFPYLSPPQGEDVFGLACLFVC